MVDFNKKLEEYQRGLKEGTIHKGFHPPGHDPETCLACKLYVERVQDNKPKDK